MYIRSQYQIDYTPDSGSSSYRLLSQGDLLTSDIIRQYSSRTQTADVVDAQWSYHVARGNASLAMSWESLVTFDSCSTAERILTLHVQELLAARQGVLRVASAYVSTTPTLVQDWTATLEGVSHRMLAASANPRISTPASLPSERTWGVVQYQWTLTHPSTI